MNELDRILRAWRERGSGVLATVVHVTGSAYRRPGARMLMLPGGQRIGSVSGGCLEGEIAKKAWWFTESGDPVVRVYDTSSDDDAVWEFGLGCNGVVHVLLERTESAAAGAMLELLASRRAAGTPAVVATVVHADPFSEAKVGDRLLLDASGVAGGALAGSAMDAVLWAQAEEALRERRSRLVHLGETQVFVEWVGPPAALLVIGAGHDAVPLVAVAAQLGWTITVADGRPAYAKVERFPNAARVVLMDAHEPLREVAIDGNTAVVMMTHNYPLDARLLPRILAMRPRYLGMLGPRTRTERLFAEVGIPAPAGVHAPVGLDIGCDSPAAIAIAVVAEVQAALSGRDGGMLSHRRGAIHAPAAEVGVAAPVRRFHAARPEYCETVSDHG